MKHYAMQAIILAAGKSSRFNTETTKLSFTLCGREMIAYPAQLLSVMDIPMTFVVGFQKESIKAIIEKYSIEKVSFVEQKEQRGTGHALLCSQNSWTEDHILVLNGDVPLITRDVITTLYEQHTNHKAAVSFITTYSSDSSAEGLGRVIKKDNSIEIIEARNCTHEDFTQLPLNAGIYIFNRQFLESTLPLIMPNQKTGEIYITDLIKYASDKNLTVLTTVASFDHVRGVNTLKELWAAEHIKRSELLTQWMNKGVRFAAALNVCLDIDIEIGAGTFIGTGAVLLNGTRIGKNCIINAFSFISNTTIHDNVDIKPHSAICESLIHEGCQVGPFAHLNNSIIKDNVIIGNFVEVKQSTISTNSEAKHLSYIGDAIIGQNVTIGAGTVTCNYDGCTKHATIIKDNALIGSNNCVVAPVIIGTNSMTAAGSVITHDVPDYALGIARARQENKEQYVTDRPNVQTSECTDSLISSDSSKARIVSRNEAAK